MTCTDLSVGAAADSTIFCSEAKDVGQEKAGKQCRWEGRGPVCGGDDGRHDPEKAVASMCLLDLLTFVTFLLFFY